jgi:hypothetical protein
MCSNHFNQRSAAILAERGQEIVEDMETWGLSKLRASLLQTRQECAQKCAFVADVIYPCLSDALQGDDEKLPVKELMQTKGSCSTALKKILYLPSVSQRGVAMARLLYTKLHRAGHEEAARVLWLYVAWTQEELLLSPGTACSGAL